MNQKTHAIHAPLTVPLSRLLILILLIFGTLGFTPSRAIAQDDQSPEQTHQSGDAQGSAPTPSHGLESPRDTLLTFLQGITETSPGGMEDALKCIDFPPGLLQSTKNTTAMELYEVLNRLERIDYSDHPKNPDSDTYTLYPDTARSLRHLAWSRKYDGKITLTQDDQGSWRFSRSTAETIHALWIATENETLVVESEAKESLSRKVRNQIPDSLKGNLILGMELWQWIGILAVVFIGIIVDHIVRTILRTAWHRFETKRGKEVEKESLARAVRPFGLLAAAGIWYFALDQGLLPTAVVPVLLVAVRLFLMISMVWAAFRVTDLISDWLTLQAAKTETKYDDLLVPMIKRTVKIFLTAIGLIYIANAFQIEILPLLTGLGIGGLAFAFAAKDTIENLFGSIAVILDRPFEIGDWVVVNDTEGTVEDLGFRSTRIRTFYNSLVTVPNATLVRATVDNYGRRKYRRFTTKLNVTYDTHPDKIEAFCAGIREIVKLHPYTRKDYYHVWLNSFGAHSLDILVYIFFECPDWSIELREKHRFMLDVVRLADRLGVEFAFPTQTLHVAQLDPNAPHSPEQIPDGDSERRAVLEGRKVARELTSNQPWKDEIPGPVTFAEEFESEYEARGDG
jgi:MscS family membrane protein